MNKIKVTSDRMYEYSSITPVPKGQIQFSKILFYLSDDWSERSIIAQFKQGEKVLNRSLNSDNTCYIPSDFDIGLVTVYLKGYDLDGSSVATANGVSIPIVQGAFDGGEPAVPPEPDLYAKLIEEFSKGIDQERISIAVEEYLNKNPIQEKDPTVPEWAKQPQKPEYTAQEVGALPATTHIPTSAFEVNAEPSGTVSQHNASGVAHNDIRLLIQGLSERLNTVADSDDTTLDQMSEIVAYIKSNKSLIDAITTSKINVSDIVDNLTTNAVNKPLSAAQGVALKALIDAISVPDKLPNPNALTFTGAVTGTYDGSAPLTVNIPAGGGGGTGGGSSGTWELIGEVTSDGAGTNTGISIPCDISGYKSIFVYAQNLTGNTNFRVVLRFKLTWSDAIYFGYNTLGTQGSANIAFQSGKMNNLWSITGLAYNVENRIFTYGAAESKYNSGSAPWRQGEQDSKLPNGNWNNIQYISLDRNSSADIVPEGCILRAWGCK